MPVYNVIGCGIRKTPNQPCLSIHSVSSVARNAPATRYGPQESQCSALMNGVKMASMKPMGHQVSSCTIMFQAGSRYEQDCEIGATHFLRVMSSASGARSTGYMKTRYLQQQGAYITCASDRQSIAYTLRCNPAHFPDLSPFLVDAACGCHFNQWDLDDRKANVWSDLEWITPEQRVLDLVQRACWSGPLYNSVFCEEGRINSMETKNIRSFVENNFTSDRCTVATYGLPFDEAMKVAEMIPPRKCKEPMLPQCMPKPRRGVEFYDLGPCSDSWVAVAVPGSGSLDLCCMMKLAILAEASGCGYLTAGQQELNKVPLSPLGCSAKFLPYQDYKAFNISYLDTGVFGILTKADANGAYEAAITAARYLAGIGNMSFTQIAIGKKRLQLALASHEGSCVRVTESLALAQLGRQLVDTAACAAALVEQISPDEVACAAKALTERRHQMAVAFVGDIGRLPNDMDILAAIC